MRVSFVRDQAAIEVRFKKLDAVYLAAFDDQLAIVKKLEGTLKLTEEQKKATAELYAEADVVNKNLNFLSSYFTDAGLPTAAISSLKKNLKRSNIEGALLEMRDLRLYVIANVTALFDEGMDAGYPAEFEAHIDRLNRILQNRSVKDRKKK